MTCFHGFSDPRDCAICMQLPLPGLADVAGDLLAGPDIDVLAEIGEWRNDPDKSLAARLPGVAPD